MSIALERIDVEPSSSGFMHGAAMSFGLIFESSPAPVASSSSSSSLGKNSDVSSGRSVDEGDEENDEAQSSYKGPLDMMEALEEVLPIRLEPKFHFFFLQFWFLHYHFSGFV